MKPRRQSLAELLKQARQRALDGERVDEVPENEHEQRPRDRSRCAHVPRPCPYVSCRYHLYLDVFTSGAVQINFPDVEVDAMPEASCALDVADRGGVALEQVGALMNCTRERVRQLERQAMEKVRRQLSLLGLRDEDAVAFNWPAGRRED